MDTAHLKRQAAVVASVAEAALQRALSVAGPSRPGEVALGLPAARQLLHGGDPPDPAALAASDTRLNDRLGHSRPPYYPLVVHLHLAAGLIDADAARPMVAKMTGEGDIALRLWRGLCRLETGDPDARSEVDAVVDAPGPSGELEPFDPQRDLLDAWWYRELVGLHALMNLAVLTGASGWLQRVDAIAAYHLENTQPDHTTAQPWGVAAFARRPASTIFAEQQMHDAQSQWMFHGPGSAILPALLLADAARALRALADDKVARQ